MPQFFQLQGLIYLWDLRYIVYEKNADAQKFHVGETMQYARKQYLEQLIRKKDNGRIKIVTGLRRSGKSYLLFTLYRQYLLDSGVAESQIVELALDEIDNAKYSKASRKKRPLRNMVMI